MKEKIQGSSRILPNINTGFLHFCEVKSTCFLHSHVSYVQYLTKCWTVEVNISFFSSFFPEPPPSRTTSPRRAPPPWRGSAPACPGPPRRRLCPSATACWPRAGSSSSAATSNSPRSVSGTDGEEMAIGSPGSPFHEGAFCSRKVQCLRKITCHEMQLKNKYMYKESN